MIKSVFKKVFSQTTYIAIAAGVSLAVFAFAVWLPNWSLIGTVLSSPAVSFGEAVRVIFGLFLSIGTNFTVLSAAYTIAIALLFGIHIALFAYYISARKGAAPKKKEGALGVGGFVSGVFGIGCASCGTFILSSALALFGAGGAVTLLPLGGEEFGILGVALLGYATHRMIRKVHAPAVCEQYERTKTVTRDNQTNTYET